MYISYIREIRDISEIQRKWLIYLVATCPMKPDQVEQINQVLDTQNVLLDRYCVNGQPHIRTSVDGKPYPCICTVCSRPLP